MGNGAASGQHGVATPAQSVVILARDPSLKLARLLRSLGRAEMIERSEVLLGINGGRAVAEAHRLATRFLPTGARVVSLPRMRLGEARNAVVSEANADVVLFLDDDVEVPRDLLVRVHEVMSDANVDVAGGPNLTPPASSRFEQLAGRVLASALGTGPVRHRYRCSPAATGSERTLILCNLATRRAVFAQAQFDNELASAEENELLIRLRRDGATILYVPALAAYHERRGTLASHFRQMAKYGFGRGQLLVRAFSPDQLPFALPALALVALPAVAAAQPRIVVVALVAYALVLGVGSLRLAGVRRAPIALALLASTHVGYGLGVLGGGLSELVRRFARASARLRAAASASRRTRSPA